jgi:hypothetical protein
MHHAQVRGMHTGVLRPVLPDAQSTDAGRFSVQDQELACSRSPLTRAIACTILIWGHQLLYYVDIRDEYNKSIHNNPRQQTTITLRLVRITPAGPVRCVQQMLLCTLDYSCVHFASTAVYTQVPASRYNTRVYSWTREYELQLYLDYYYRGVTLGRVIWSRGLL